MRIAVDVREACRECRAGKGQWVYGFVSELLTRRTEAVLLTDAALPAEWRPSGAQECCFRRGPLWHVSAAAALSRRRDIDFFIAPTSFIVPFLTGRRIPHIPVVHDLIAFRGEPHHRKATAIEKLTLPRTLSTARHVLAVSESTKRDLLNRFGTLDASKISVVFAGPMHVHPLPAQGGAAILCTATLSPRKNQRRLIQAYALLSPDLRKQHPLILAGGRGWSDASIVKLAGETEGVEWKGYVSSAEYDRLLGSAAVLALPSLYEGFGMQVLDALQRGIPVLTSGRGSLSEVTGECAVLVDPEDVESIAKGLERILADSTLRENLRRCGPAQAAKFSWKRTVDLFLAAVEGLQ